MKKVIAGFNVYKNRTGYVRDYGKIQLGDSVIIGDPCYDYEGMLHIKNVKSGDYECFARFHDCKDWGWRVSRLFVFHTDITLNEILPVMRNGQRLPYLSRLERKEYPASFGVDSGQGCICNYEFFKENESDREFEPVNGKKGWYRKLCDITLSKESAGIYQNKCFVSSSGYGDGGYTCFTFEKDGKIFGFMIDYAVEGIGYGNE